MQAVPRLTRKQLAAFLSERGYPISLSTLEKLGMPSVSEGPPVARYWGKRPLYDAGAALKWAEARTTKP